MRVLIADDESHIVMELEYILSHMQDIEVLKSCISGNTALEAIVKLEPDVVFLDIEMPGLSGIQLGHVLKTIQKPPYIIYVTAHEKFALEAFKVGARGYILKPFSEADIKEQIRLAAINFAEVEKQMPEEEKRKFASIPKVGVEINGRFSLLDQQDIMMAYASDRSVYIRAEGRDYVCQFSLAELENRLQKEMFFRCHRNYIVNLYRVIEVRPWFNNTYVLLMDDNETEVPVSRSQRIAIKNMFNL